MDQNNDAINLVNSNNARKQAIRRVQEWERSHPTQKNEQNHLTKFKGKIPHKSRAILPPSVRKRLAALLLTGALSLGAYTIYKGFTTPPPENEYINNTTISMSEDAQEQLEELNNRFESISKDNVEEIKLLAKDLHAFNEHYIKDSIREAFDSKVDGEYTGNVEVYRNSYGSYPHDIAYTADISTNSIHQYMDGHDFELHLYGETFKYAINNMILLQPDKGKYTSDYTVVKNCLNKANKLPDTFIISYDSRDSSMKEYEAKDKDENQITTRNDNKSQVNLENKDLEDR